eukprot:Stramenopile-MAST_4_protein_2661
MARCDSRTDERATMAGGKPEHKPMTSFSMARQRPQVTDKLLFFSEHVTQPISTAPQYMLLLSNIPLGLGADQIHDTFELFGPILYCRMLLNVAPKEDRQNGFSSDCCVIAYQNPTSVATALAYNELIILSQPVYLHAVTENGIGTARVPSPEIDPVSPNAGALNLAELETKFEGEKEIERPNDRNTSSSQRAQTGGCAKVGSVSSPDALVAPAEKTPVADVECSENAMVGIHETKESGEGTKEQAFAHPAHSQGEKRPAEGLSVTSGKNAPSPSRSKGDHLVRKKPDKEPSLVAVGSLKPPTEPTPSTPVFTVEPETVSLKPNTGCEFSFYGNTPLTKDFLEELVCEIKQGKEKKGRPVLSCKCHGIFINPVLEPSAKQLSYVYTWRDGIPLATQTQPITLRNVSELPLEFILRTAEPFSIDSYEFKLMPNETSTVNVTFDPGYRDDRVSHVAEGKLTAVYREHPNKDNIPLIGEINFPNLEFDYTTVDFGTCLNDTTQTVSVRVTNTSQIDTDLSWTFEADEDAARKAATAAKPYIPVNQVFDVLPIRSLLRPGESEVVEFAFYGHANRRFRTTCVGLVQGGPEYPIMLQGEAALIAHRIDQTYLDFGKVPYDVEDEVKEFSITNPGKVPFDFRLRLDELSRPGVVIAGPLSGKIYAGDKQKITVKFQPGIPDRIMETVKVDIAHFEPIMFPVYGHGIFTNIHVSLPREDANDEVWLATVEEARRAIEGVQNGDVVANRPPLPPAIVPPDMDNARPDTTLTTGRAAQKGVVPSPLDGTVELSIDNLPGSAVPAPPKTAPAMMAIPISGRKDSQETVV